MNKLVKQSEALQPQIIQGWAQENRKIVIGHYDRKIATFFESDDKNEQFQNLHKLIVKWTVLCGVKPIPSDEEIRLFVEYVAEHFYRLSLLEIDNAFNLATAGVLNIDASHYQSFSVIYISKIINAYKDYKGKFILDYQAELEKNEKREPTESERLHMMVDAILESFDAYKEKPTYNDFGYVAYDFLNNLGLINFNKELKKEILKQAREKVIERLTLKRKEHTGGTTEYIEVSTAINDIQADKTGSQNEVVNECKNIGLCQYYNFILENNLSLKQELESVLVKE
jgi:hypothetical protein